MKKRRYWPVFFLFFCFIFLSTLSFSKDRLDGVSEQKSQKQPDATQSLRQKIMLAEKEAMKWEALLKKEESNHSKAKILHKALSAAKQMDEYEAELRVIAPSTKDNKEKSGLSTDLQKRLRLLLHQSFQIVIEITGPHSPEIESAIRKAVHREGFTSHPEGRLIVSGSIHFEKTGPKSRTWHFIRWRTRIILKDRETTEVFGTIRRTAREGGRSQEETEEKALRTLKKELSEKIRKDIFRYVFGGESLVR